MATTNADLAFMAGDDRDTLYLGPRGTDLSTVADLDSKIPAGLIDVGWLSDDGLTMDMSDSVDEIKGHQGHKTIRTYMSDSTTQFTAVLFEAKLAVVSRYLGATKQEKVTSASGSATVLTVPSSRKVETLCGVADIYDVSTGKRRRYVLPRLELGERGSIEYKVGSLTGFEHNLKVLDDYRLITDETGMAIG